MYGVTTMSSFLKDQASVAKEFCQQIALSQKNILVHIYSCMESPQ